jgi:orotate phosphoribosyltransferase
MTGPRVDLDLDMEALGRQVLDAALLRGDFVLSSGERSSYYLDKYLFETQPGILRLLARAMAIRVPADTQRIAGTELGAVALAAALSLETDIPFVIARKSSKDYSTAKAVEGLMEPGERIVVVEDVITTGTQAIRAAGRIREAGGHVSKVLAVVDREEGGAAAIADAGLALDVLFTRRGLGLE